MDEKTVRTHAEAHGEAVRTNDLGAAAGDLTDEVKTYVGDIMKRFPRPVTAAEVVRVDPSGEQYLAVIRYSGADESIDVESRWDEIEGTPRIVELKAI